MTRLCEKAFSQHLVTARNSNKIKPDGEDGWRDFIHSSVSRVLKFSSSSQNPKYCVQSIIEPVIEVHIVKILDEYGIELAIQSISNPENTRETERFVTGIHDHKTDVRSSNELLEHLQESETKAVTCSKEIWAVPSTTEPVQALSAFSRQGIPLHMENHSHEWEKSGWLVAIWRSFGSVDFQNGHDNVTTFRPRRMRTWWVETWEFNQISNGQKNCTRRSARFQFWSVVTKDFLKAIQRKESNTAKTKMDSFVICELFKDTLVVFQSRQNWWVEHPFFAIGKKHISLAHGLIPDGKKRER